MATQGILDFVAPTPCHQEIEGKTLWGYPALCLVQHDEGNSYSVRWLTEHVGLTFPEHKRPASFGLRDTVEGYPVHSKSQTTLDGQDNSREGSYDTPRTFSPNQPSSPQGERTRANYAGVLDIPAHLNDAQKYRLRSFLYRGRTALTGTIVRTYQDPKDGRSRRYSSIELVIRSPEVEEFFKSGRKSSGGGIDNDYVIRSDPVPFLLYSFYLKDRESRGGVIDVSLILVHDSFEELLVRQEEILTELGKLKEWLEARAEEKYKQGGVLSREEENALRNNKTRRPLAELIGPCPDMPQSPIRDSEAALDHTGNHAATRSPRKSLADTKPVQGSSPKGKEGSFPSDISPFRREFTAPFPSVEHRANSNAVESEGADLDPNADDSTSQPARSPTTMNPASPAAPILKFPYLNYVVHCAFEYILNRVFSPDAKCKEQKIEDLAIQASALMTKDRNDSYQTVRSLWGLVRPSTSALEVIARSTHQRGMGKPGLTFNEIGTLMRALFRGNQIIIISQSSPSDANDFAIALSAFLPPGLATVLLGAHTYRPSYECNILTFSEEFYSTYEIQRHRTFTLSGKEQFVLAEELDQHSVCVSIDPIGSIPVPTDGPANDVEEEEDVVSDSAIAKGNLEDDIGTGIVDPLHPLQTVAVILHSLEQADELAKGNTAGADPARGDSDTVKHSYIVRKVIPRIMNIPPEDTAELWEEDIRLTEQEIIQDVAAFATLGKLYVELLSTWAANKPLQAVRSSERARVNTPAGRTAAQLASHREQRPNTSILNRMLNWVSNVGHSDKQQQSSPAPQQPKEVESTTPITRSERMATSVRDLTDQDISLMTASLGLESCDHDVLRYLASKPRLS